MKDLTINVALQINRPVETVFRAIVKPEHMSNYFISEASGEMKENASLVWKFPEFPDMEVQVKVKKADSPREIEFEWEGDESSILTVNIQLESIKEEACLVRISEGTMPINLKGLTWLKRNTEGWANFLACLKAYVEFDINLRKGGFDFMRKEE